jgi:hypothetical protein
MTLWKKHTVLVFLIFFAVPGLSQEYEWSNADKYRSSKANNRIIGKNESGCYILRSRLPGIKSKGFIERYQENLRLDFSKRIPGLKGCRFVEAFVNEDHLVIWKSRFNQKTEKLDIVYQLTDNEAEIISGETVAGTAALRNYSDNGDFMVYRNKEKTHYALVYSEPAPQKHSYLNICVFDNAFNRVSVARKEIAFEYEDFNLEQVELDTLGNCYILLTGVNRLFNKGTPERLGTHLYALGKGQESWQSFYLNFSDTYVHHPRMVIDHSNAKVIVSAYYSLQSISHSMGILDFSIRTDGFGILYHNFIPYTFGLVSEIIGEKAAREGLEPEDFVLRELVARTDGGYLLIGEEFNISQQSYTYMINGMTQISSRSVFNYGKIMLVSVSPQGAIEWTKVINKIQSTLNDYGHFSSFASLIRKDRVYLIFNDKIKGLGDVLLFVLDNQGNLEKETLLGSQSAFISIIPGESRQLDANTILLATAKDRKFAFLKITF